MGEVIEALPGAALVMLRSRESKGHTEWALCGKSSCERGWSIRNLARGLLSNAVTGCGAGSADVC